MAYNDMSCDVLIAGCGVAGLYAALNMPTNTNIIMLSKGKVDECDSMLAQGGICVLPEGQDYDSFFEDTLKAGHGENRRESVDIMIRSSRTVINDLLALGVDFKKNEDGSLDFTREGAHARPRIAYFEDTTGKEITTKLLVAVRELSNVQILEHVAMVDILTEQRSGQEVCRGVRVMPVSEESSVMPVDELTHESFAQSGEEPIPHDMLKEPAATFTIEAQNVLWATGGIGGVYAHSTNFPQLTGDALYIATKHGIKLADIDYVQIHPTGLYSERPGRTFLISESCRGEGAILLDAAGERFTDELQPRDVVAAAIENQMKKDGAKHEWLSFEPVPREDIVDHFKAIRARCQEEGYDILEQPIPVVPTQHYFMGGVWVNRDSATSMPHLYAAGETACNGVHGKNRLASNSLLESLVFARRSAYRITTGKSLGVELVGTPALDGMHRGASEQGLAIDILCDERNTNAHEQLSLQIEKRHSVDPVAMKLYGDDLILRALREDISFEDVSTASVCPEPRQAEVQLIAKARGIIAGLDVFARTFELLDPAVQVEAFVSDGDAVGAGQQLAIVRGDVRVLLSGERVALNYLQRMSGIATMTNNMAEALEGTKTKLVDTRKTTPGMRIFEKAAVALGGGANHRYNLSTAVMLKDNHIDAAGGVTKAIAAARAHASFTCTVEVECEDLAMVEEALAAGADIIMLDNMSHDDMAEAIKRIGGKAKVEASGNVDATNIRALADLGVDYISSGALTHSAPILDLSLKHLRIVDEA